MADKIERFGGLRGILDPGSTSSFIVDPLTGIVKKTTEDVDAVTSAIKKAPQRSKAPVATAAPWLIPVETALAPAGMAASTRTNANCCIPSFTL